MIGRGLAENRPSHQRSSTLHSLDNPFLEWLGVRLVTWSPGYAEMQLDTAPQLGNRTGRVQGGVVATLLDAVAGYAGLHAEPGTPQLEGVTLSLTTNYLNSGAGKVLTAKGMLERKGRGIFFSRAEVWLDSSLLIASAVGTFKYVRGSAPRS
jgi:uncharacterized protein (TIGR00369 family)